MGYHLASSEEIKDGCPPGKAVLWVTKCDNARWFPKDVVLSGYLIYDTLGEALSDMPIKMVYFGGEHVLVNHKSEDGDSLDVWHLKNHTLKTKRK